MFTLVILLILVLMSMAWGVYRRVTAPPSAKRKRKRKPHHDGGRS
jgi:hypothetical protein